MPTPYEKIYENVLPKFKSYDILKMTENEVKEYLHDYLISAISRFHVCKKDLSNRDDNLEQFNVDLSDIEIEILSNYIVIEYLDSNYIKVPSLLKVALPSKDFIAYSPANMLDKLTVMHDMYRKENEGLLSRYAWINNTSTFKSGYKQK